MGKFADKCVGDEDDGKVAEKSEKNSKSSVDTNKNDKQTSKNTSGKFSKLCYICRSPNHFASRCPDRVAEKPVEVNSSTITTTKTQNGNQNVNKKTSNGGDFFYTSENSMLILW